MSSTMTAMIVIAIPAARFIAVRPAATPYLLGAIAFIVAFATALGIISANPKTFLVLFLTFWYVVVNDRGTAALNFGGVHGLPQPNVTAAYAGIAIAAVAIAQGFYAMRLRRGD